MVTMYNGLPPNAVLDQATARYEYVGFQNKVMKTVAYAFDQGMKKTSSFGQLPSLGSGLIMDE